MKKYSAFISALILGFFVLSSINPVRAAGGSDTIIAEEISKEDAAKNYPPDKGKSYPEGAAASTSTGGFFQSPYSGKVFDCRKVKRGH